MVALFNHVGGSFFFPLVWFLLLITVEVATATTTTSISFTRILTCHVVNEIENHTDDDMMVQTKTMKECYHERK